MKTTYQYDQYINPLLLAAFAGNLSKYVHSQHCALKGQPNQFQIYAFSQFLQSQYSMHRMSSYILTIPFLQGHFVVRSDGMANFLVGTNSPFSMIHSHFAGSSIVMAPQ